jgi:hypothetical protein
MAKITEVSGEILTGAVSGNLKLPMLSVSVSLTPDTTSTQAMHAVDAVCTALARQAQSIGYLRVLLGRLLAEVQDRELYKPEFATFEAYKESLDVKYRLSRTVLNNALMIVRQLPDMQPEDAADKPVVSLMLVARAAANGAETKVVKKLLKEAGERTIEEFREKVEEQGLVGKRGRPNGGARRSGPVTLRIITNARTAGRFRDRAGDDPGKYLERLLSLDTDSARTTAAA